MPQQASLSLRFCLYVSVSADVFQRSKVCTVGDLLCAQLHDNLAGNRFEIEFLAGRPPGLRNGLAACALHGPEACSELAMLAVLRSPALRSLPLLPALLRPPPAVAAGSGKHASHCVPCLCIICEQDTFA